MHLSSMHMYSAVGFGVLPTGLCWYARATET